MEVFSTRYFVICRVPRAPCSQDAARLEGLDAANEAEESLTAALVPAAGVAASAAAAAAAAFAAYVSTAPQLGGTVVECFSPICVNELLDIRLITEHAVMVSAQQQLAERVSALCPVHQSGEHTFCNLC